LASFSNKIASLGVEFMLGFSFCPKNGSIVFGHNHNKIHTTKITERFSSSTASCTSLFIKKLKKIKI
jgi:hypothetical protein